MSLALAHHAAPAFNGLYYSTMAGVIPVLFLAIVLQGPTYQDLLQAAMRLAARGRESPRYPWAALALAGACMIGIVYAAAGEIGTIVALLYQRAIWATGGMTLTSASILTILAAAGPARQVARTIGQVIHTGARAIRLPPDADDALQLAVQNATPPVTGEDPAAS